MCIRDSVNATFICCDIYDLPAHLNEQFDIIFTSYGEMCIRDRPISDEALKWLPQRGEAKDDDFIFPLTHEGTINNRLQKWAKAEMCIRDSPDGIPAQVDRLPLEAAVHDEKYHDYTPEGIDKLYAYKESLPENKQFIEENKKETLAQVFTDVR